MPDVSNGRCEEDRRHPTHTPAHAVVAKGAEVHALLEGEDFTHGLHLAIDAACSGTMKRAAFQGVA